MRLSVYVLVALSYGRFLAQDREDWHAQSNLRSRLGFCNFLALNRHRLEGPTISSLARVDTAAETGAGGSIDKAKSIILSTAFD